MIQQPKRFPRPHSRGIWTLGESLKKLSIETKVSNNLINSVLKRRIDPYVEFKMRKRSSGFRTIAVPRGEFRPVLDHLLENFQQYFIHPAAFAYVNGRSVVDAARLHSGMKWGVKVDLKDFFESVDEDKIYIALRRSGLGRKPARTIAGLTTRLKVSNSTHSVRKYKRGYPHGVRAHRSKLKSVGHLPQGSPTSGYLSNLAAWDLDCQLTALANDLGMTYTRYSDDILFSSKESDFNRENALALVSKIRSACNSFGFDLNNRKTRVLTPGSRMQYLGLLLDEPGVRLGKEKRKNIEATMWALEKYGTMAHANHLGFNDEAGCDADSPLAGILFFNRFWGQLAYVLDVDPKFGQGLLTRLVNLRETDEFFKNHEDSANIVNSATRLLAQEHRWAALIGE